MLLQDKHFLKDERYLPPELIIYFPPELINELIKLKRLTSERQCGKHLWDSWAAPRCRPTVFSAHCFPSCGGTAQRWLSSAEKPSPCAPWQSAEKETLSSLFLRKKKKKKKKSFEKKKHRLKKIIVWKKKNIVWKKKHR